MDIIALTLNLPDRRPQQQLSIFDALRDSIEHPDIEDIVDST
jgi:hypothetical protein